MNDSDSNSTDDIGEVKAKSLETTKEEDNFQQAFLRFIAFLVMIPIAYAIAAFLSSVAIHFMDVGRHPFAVGILTPLLMVINLLVMIFAVLVVKK